MSRLIIISIRGYLVEQDHAGLQLRVRNENLMFLFLNETYVVGTQKNRLNETVLLRTQNITDG